MSVVLIVEDEMLEQEFLRSVIQDELFSEDTLLTCETGLQAVQLSRQHQPDLIFMDVLLPEMDGLTSIHDIKTFLPNAYVAILSAYSDFTYAQKAIDLGVFKYLVKPVKPATFQETFREMRLASMRTPPAEGRKAPQPPAQLKVKEDRQCFIEESVQYINEHFRERLTLEMVSCRVYVNPKYFSHMFKKQIGVAFTEYVNGLRVQYACRLLRTTNYPAYRVSLESGFSDPSYFNRVFCARMNVTPQAYRRKISSRAERGA